MQIGRLPDITKLPLTSTVLDARVEDCDGAAGLGEGVTIAIAMALYGFLGNTVA